MNRREFLRKASALLLGAFLFTTINQAEKPLVFMVKTIEREEPKVPNLDFIPRSQTLLPPAPSIPPLRGPFSKVGIMWHHMCGAGTGDSVSHQRALQLQLNNYNWHLHRWGAPDIFEAYDLYIRDGKPCLIEGRPWYTNCDAFSGMSKEGYRWIGVEIDGNYETRHPSNTMLEGMVETALLLKRESKVPDFAACGHLDKNHLSSYGPTNCPGKFLYPRIPEVMREAERRFGEEEEDMYAPLQLVYEGGGTYVYAACPVSRDTSFAFYSDVPDDYSVDIYIHPIAGQGTKSKKGYGCGGYGNPDVKGAMNVVGTIYPDLNGVASMVIHSPHKLVGGAW